jgi:hypothetical protein
MSLREDPGALCDLLVMWGGWNAWCCYAVPSRPLC